MKKLLIVLSIIAALLVALSLLLWTNRAKIASLAIAKQMHIPVTIDSLDISKGKAAISKF